VSKFHVLQYYPIVLRWGDTVACQTGMLQFNILQKDTAQCLATWRCCHVGQGFGLRVAHKLAPMHCKVNLKETAMSA